MRSISMKKSGRWFYCPDYQRPRMVSWWQWAIPVRQEPWSLMMQWVTSQQRGVHEVIGVGWNISECPDVDQRGKPMNKDNKKNDRSKSKSTRGNSKSRSVGCWRCGEKGHIQRDCKQKNDGEGNSKEKVMRTSRQFPFIFSCLNLFRDVVFCLSCF